MVYFGKLVGTREHQPECRARAGPFGRNLRYGLAGAGDVNGDGFATDRGHARDGCRRDNEGAAFVFLGNGGRAARASLTRQLRADGSDGRSSRGSAWSTDRFEVSTNAVDPSGRGRVKIEVEHCPADQAFAVPGCVREVTSSWLDVGAASSGVALSREIVVANAGLYRWRCARCARPSR